MIIDPKKCPDCGQDYQPWLVWDGNETWLVLGGGGFSVIPRDLMETLGADYGIAGEGERAFARLLD
jgi:radical SAM superfamily enzyme YgiQ (UPF0313 family)